MPSLGPVKPRLRGVIHQWSFFVALVAGAVLVVLAPSGRATAAAAIYAAALAGLLGTSALYHRVTWRPTARAWMRRLDHSMIFVLIAGTYTPFAVLVLTGPTRTVVLVGVWAGALAGIVFCMVWIRAPNWLSAASYVALGWFAVVAFPQIFQHAGAGAGVLLAGRWRGLHRRRRGVRAPAPGSESRRLRLPRGVPRARGGGRPHALRGRGGVRVACWLGRSGARS